MDTLRTLFCLISLLQLQIAKPQNPGPPVITSLHEALLVREGSSYNLNCRASGADPIEYQWIKNGAAITSFSRTGSFSVGSATREDAAEYRCLAKNSYGATLSPTTNLTVAYLGEFSTSFIPGIQASREGFFILKPPPLTAAPLTSIEWRWYFQDSVVFSNLTHFVSRNGELVVLDAHFGNSGEYKVEATHSLFPRKRVSSNAYRVSIQGNYQFQDGDPKIVLPPKRVKFQRDRLGGADRFSLECVGHSRDLNNLQIIWRHNGSVIASDQIRHEIRDYGRLLTVKNPRYRYEGGQYTCEARRGSVSSAPRETWVEVHESPVITLPLSPVTAATIAERTELPCRAEGFPVPKFRWYFNGYPLDDQLSCCPDNPPMLLGRDGSLLINAITKESSGVYQCEPENDAGSVLTYTWLHTEAKGPRLRTKPQNSSVPAGKDAEFRCQAEGSPPPLVQWKYNGTNIIPDGRKLRAEGDSLLISTTENRDAGWYTCVASNSQGTTESRAYLSVAGHTQIIRGPVDQNAVIGSNVEFQCQVSAEAERKRYTRSWYFNGQLVTTGSSRTIDLRPDGSLYIRQVGPSKIGNYTCTITSAFGTQTESAILRIVEKPGMPLHVKAQLLNETLPAKIRVSWTAGFDGNSPIIKYLLQHRILGARELWSDWETAIENIGREQLSAVVDNLKPSSVYEFRVVAVNRFGPGIPSQSSNDVTLPQQPPAAAPRSVAGSARSSSSIMVQWQPPPPEQWNGDILGYHLRYRLANYPNIPWINRNVSDSRARNVLLEDLITWREYEIQVSAYNERGMGVFSKSQYITTLEGIPSEAPKNVNASVINSTAIFVSFTPPPQQMIPGVNLGFKVEAWKGPTMTGMLAKEVRILPYSVSSIETVINGLEKYVAYNVTTVCFTAPGDGPRSPPISLRTKEDIPGPVVNMRFDEVLFSSVKVLWDQPSSPNGVLLNYTLAYWVTNRSSTTRQEFKIPPEKTSFKVLNLRPSTHYSFELYAETRIGRGPSQMATMESGVPPELPGPPSALVVSNVKSDSATLQFLPGYDGKTIITRWIVQGQIGSATAWALVFNISDPRASSINLKGLRPFTIYRLRLIAENVVGKSPASQPAENFQTLQAPPRGPLSDFSAEPYSSNSIALSWTPLQSFSWNGVPKGYIIQYRMNQTATDALRRSPNNRLGLGPLAFGPPIEESFAEQEVLNPAAGDFILSSMKPFTAYDFKILPFNDYGRGKETVMKTASTYEGKPSAAPANVQVTAESSTKGRITWSQVPREYTNGMIVGFKIRYKRQSGDMTEEKQIEVLGPERRDYLLEDLESFAQYQIQVAAFTIMGQGPPNSPDAILQTLEDVPGPPSDVKFQYVSLDQVRITWDTPYSPNGIIKQYQIAHWRNSSSPKAAVRTEVSRDTRMFAASGLQSQTVYAFTVSAETSVGWGEDAKVYVYTTTSKVPPHTPSEPVQNTNHPQRPREIGIRWESAISFSNPVRLVKVEFQEANVGEWVRWQEKVPGSLHRAVIENLSPHTAYRFRLKAENDFGQSSWSKESEWIKTIEDSPQLPPGDITATPFDSSAIKIGWSPPPVKSWNSDFVGYRILFKPYLNKQEAMQTRELPMAGKEEKRGEFIIEGLPRFQHYVVQLQSFNQRGSSPPSTPVFVYVGYSVPKTSITNLRTENRSSTQIMVFWDPWPSVNEPVSGFKIRYAPQAEKEWKEEIVKNAESRVLLSDLQKFTQYTIRVSPFNKAGEGPVAEEFTITPQDRPGPVGQLIFSDIMLDSVNVSWASPKEANGEIIGYLVHYETYRDEIEYVQKIQEKVKQTFMRATNLETNVTYNFWVKAETSMGYGPRVAGKVKIGPQPGSPQSPKELQVTPRDTSVSLYWKNRDPGASPITSHIIQVKRLSSAIKNTMDATSSTKTDRSKRQANGPSHPRGEWHKLTTLESSRTSHSISYDDLEKSSIYVFRVFARNAHGVSAPSPQSAEIEVPEDKEEPFYLQWWFLVILGLISVVIIVVIVALLCITGRNSKYKYEKRNSSDSLQLADGGIVTYELRASQRANKTLQKHAAYTNYAGRVPPRPDPGKRRDDDGSVNSRLEGYQGPAADHSDFAPPPYGSVIRGPGSTISAGSQNRIGPVNSLYDSLAVGTVVPGQHVGFPPGSSHRSNPHYENQNYPNRSRLHNHPNEHETSTTGEDEEESDTENEKDVSSIVQHYQTSDVAYRETWRRAKKREAHRPPSLSSQSETVSVQNGASAYGYHGHPTAQPQSRGNTKNGVPGFSSFV